MPVLYCTHALLGNQCMLHLREAQKASQSYCIIACLCWAQLLRAEEVWKGLLIKVCLDFITVSSQIKTIQILPTLWDFQFSLEILSFLCWVSFPAKPLCNASRAHLSCLWRTERMETPFQLQRTEKGKVERRIHTEEKPFSVALCFPPFVILEKRNPLNCWSNKECAELSRCGNLQKWWKIWERAMLADWSNG